MKKLALFAAVLAPALPAIAGPSPDVPTASKPMTKESRVVCEMVEQTGSILRERVCRTAAVRDRDPENVRRDLEDIRDQAERDAVRNVPNALRPNSPQ